MKTTIALTAVCLTFAVLRVAMPSQGLNQGDVFKDLAHVWVGFMFGLAIATKRRELWAMAIGLTTVEVIAALVK